jgi:hypothetical protein
MPARENLPKILERRGWVRLVPRFPMSRLSISTRGNVLAIRSKHDASGDTHAVSAHVETMRSVCFRPKYQIKIRRFSERSEVPVSREQRNALIDTRLGN